MDAAANDAESLLLVTHVLIRQGPHGPLIDDQTAAGIMQWCRHFDAVTYYGVIDRTPATKASSATWVDASQGLLGERARLVALPSAYRVGKMARHYRQVRATLREEIARHHHLCFTVGGLIGDWPALGAVESIRQGRRYSAWIDRVEASVWRNKMIGEPITRRLAAAIVAPAMERYTRHILRRSTVALLQGRDTFDHYAPWAPEPHCIYDTHTRAADQIDAATLADKQARIASGAPLEIVYVGRADAMKGPRDWIDALARAHRAGVPLRATWVGDGPMLPEMRERVAAAGIAGMVDLPGFEGDREALLQRLRHSDILLYCHKTAESARCLIEALVSGCAILGYGTAYPQGLVEERGGGIFAVQDDVATLAARIEDLHRDRGALSRLVGQAAASGALYDEDKVYAERAALMQRA